MCWTSDYCTVIVSMREERFYRAKSTGVLDAYHTNGFHLSSPIIKAVFLKRLIYTLKKLSNSTDLPTDYHINSNTDSDTIKSFLQICLKELRRDGSHLQNFLTNSTHGDVRQALDYLKSFFISGYTNIQEFASNINWKFQKHQILRPMMIPDRFFYDERYSNIPNVYQIRSEGNTSHFTMLRILWELNGKTFDRKSHGFIDAKYLIQEFQVKYDMKQDCISCLDVLLSKALVEASNRLDNYSQNVDQIRITPFGRFMLNNLCMEFTYLDLVSLDCGLYDEKLSIDFAQSALNEVNYFYANNFMDRIRSRLDRVDKFIEYLCKLEEREMKTLGLGIDEKRFTIELASSFKGEKETISHSADKKKMRELADIY